MNDPHIAALLYRVEYSPFFTYGKVQPCAHELAGFRVRIESEQATVEPKQHFATVEDAQEVIEPVLRAWELHAALKNDRPVLRFVYLRPEIVDRNPTPGVVRLQGGLSITFRVGNIVPHLDVTEYPAPPSGLVVNHGSDVEAMFETWSKYKAGQARLGDTADFCRGALEKGGGRQAAADRYGVDRLVMDKLGGLAAQKGGPHARKYKGYGRPYTDAERAWLEAVLKKLIRRAAEVAYDPSATRALITLDDLPPF